MCSFHQWSSTFKTGFTQLYAWVCILCDQRKKGEGGDEEKEEGQMKIFIKEENKSSK